VKPFPWKAPGTLEAGPIVQSDDDSTGLVSFQGHLDVQAAGEQWTATLRAAREAADRTLVLDLAAVESCDTAGAAMLLAAERAHRGRTRIAGASAQVAAVLARARQAAVVPPAPVTPPALDWRRLARAALAAQASNIAFLGEAALAILRLPARRRLFRMPDLLRVADHAGVRALPLIVLLGTLIGLILAFQSAIPMRRFGADLYVANLVSISLLRELGPLLSAVILAGRTGSAFAAEIGTMKVNQEIDALTTMGLDPMTMLVLPRLAGAVLVMPALAMALNLAGLFGMGLVMMMLGYPPIAIAHQVIGSVRPEDLYSGLFKAMVFGATVAAIGCRSGLNTGVGPRAVGLAATAAVVGGIVASIGLDGIFALIFYRLGL
jgi:phospholipid/cholesterol/gamma-HCH transport system permease protein